MSTMHRSIAIFVQCLAALSCTLPAGCMLPYAYPHLSHLAGVDVNQQAVEVHAFRVDARVQESDGKASTADYQLGRVPLAADGRVSANTRVDLDYGLYVVGVAVNFPVHYSHHTETRLYRRGYHLIEFQNEAVLGKIDWKPADLAGQEKAVDDLLALPHLRLGLTPPAKEQEWSIARLAPGTASPATARRPAVRRRGVRTPGRPLWRSGWQGEGAYDAQGARGSRMRRTVKAPSCLGCRFALFSSKSAKRQPRHEYSQTNPSTASTTQQPR